ncbi:hypothetical protein ON010_g17644 [Phytophthora cinnamomi]|nr:hypothetical protein ON010_g17644 [Phytophthora cinnamomi]
MGYFARYLAQESRSATAFCLQFGKYQFKRLPTGISTALDEYQSCMERILGDLPFAIVYLDDILIFSENAVDHVEHLRIVFERLRQYDVTLNAKKCHILREQVDYLGFTLSADGIQPQTKKIEAIQQIAEPRNKRELPRHNRLTSKNIPFAWTSEDAAAFQEIKAALARNVWLAFPDYNRCFHVFADASGQQIGGVIIQCKQIIACFSRSMTDAQRKYSTMEWEMLSVVEILKEYRTMLLLRYDFVQQVAEDELFAVDEEEVAIDGAVMKKHQLQDKTCKQIITRLEKNEADPDYSLRPALGLVLLQYRKRVMKAKLHGGKQHYGHLPPTPCSSTDRPFDVVHADLVGLLAGGFYCLTVIEQQFRCLEVMMQRGKTSATTAISFERVWLCRYPRPKVVVHDQGPEFTGDEFQLLLISMAIKDKPITAKKPQANAICELVHLEIMNILRVRPDLNDQLEVALDYAVYAIRASYHSMLRASPAQLLFGEDMITRQCCARSTQIITTPIPIQNPILTETPYKSI